jgi:hypothetical protein
VLAFDAKEKLALGAAENDETPANGAWLKSLPLTVVANRGDIILNLLARFVHCHQFRLFIEGIHPPFSMRLPHDD